MNFYSYLLILLVVILYVIAFYSLYKILITGFSSGRLAPFVPLNELLIKKAIKSLNLQSNDHFIDIGSGDGRVVFKAAKSKLSKCDGVEIDLWLCTWSKFVSLLKRIRNVNFYHKNARSFDYSDYNKVFFYLTSELVEELIPKLLKEVKPGSIIVSAVFPLEKYVSLGVGKISSVEVDLGKKVKHIWVWEL